MIRVFLGALFTFSDTVEKSLYRCFKTEKLNQDGYFVFSMLSSTSRDWCEYLHSSIISLTLMPRHLKTNLKSQRMIDFP